MEGVCAPYGRWVGENMCQLNIYICIGYILPTIIIMFLSRKFANTRSLKALRDYFALAESSRTPATLDGGPPRLILIDGD